MGIAGIKKYQRETNRFGVTRISGQYADISLLTYKYTSKSFVMNEYPEGSVLYWGYGIKRKYGPQSINERGKEGSYCGWNTES